MDFERVLLEFSRQGYACAQIMVKLALELLGEENPQLIRAMSGLNAGMGKSGSCCGVLSGGAAALGLFTGKGEDHEVPHEKAEEIVAAYANWFREAYGSDRCFDIIGGKFELTKSTCPHIIEAGYYKVLDLLEAYELLD